MSRNYKIIKLEEIKQFVYIFDGKLYYKNKNKLVKQCKKGYSSVTINGKSYRYHRILYQLYHNLEEIPVDYVIDHKNRDRTNNNIDNLRLATNAQNSRNSTVTNKFGIKGLNYSFNFYVVNIICDGIEYSDKFDFTEDGYINSINWLLSKRTELHCEFGNGFAESIKTHKEIENIIKQINEQNQKKKANFKQYIKNTNKIRKITKKPRTTYTYIEYKDLPLLQRIKISIRKFILNLLK